MRRNLTGWLLVSIQLILLLLLVFAPLYHSFSNSLAQQIIGLVLIIIGLAAGFIAARNLGNALTPTPVPKSDSTLKRAGLYKRIRHPIYTSVMLIAIGILLERPAVSTIILSVITFLFFFMKSTYEERLLNERFGDYPEYRKKTGRFWPKLKL